MNNLTILLVLFLFAINVQCKSVFKIKVERALLAKEDAEYATGRMWVSKVNRYTNVVNGKVTIHKDVPNDAKVTLRLFEFLNNEYRPFAINLERQLCTFLKMEYKNFFYPDFVKVGAHFPEPRCPLVKGNYSFANYTPDDTNFPPTLPFKKSRMDVGFWIQNQERVIIRVFVTFDRDVIIREKFT